ncbi:hypothetical protein EDC04DRAFT_2611613 [Pisolithus marmoratus]|nr:hypothetical protein EDC04DRAFT_2611613 [Pisolithus marmoratus]
MHIPDLRRGGERIAAIVHRQLPEYEVEVTNFVGWRVSEKHIAYPDGQAVLFQGFRLSYRSLTRTLVYSSASVLESFAYPCIARIVLACSKRLQLSGFVTSSPPFQRSRYGHPKWNLSGRDAQGHPIPYQCRQNAGITSKHSFSDGSRVAAECLKTQSEDRGAVFRFTPFLEGLAFNLVCRYYNAIWRDPVPGRNDDGSGTISILHIAQTGMIFRSNVELVALAVKSVFYWDRRHTLGNYTRGSPPCAVAITDLRIRYSLFSILSYEHEHPCGKFFHEQGHTATKSSNVWAQSLTPYITIVESDTRFHREDVLKCVVARGPQRIAIQQLYATRSVME